MIKSFSLGIVLYKRSTPQYLTPFESHFRTIFPYLISEGCDGRTDRRTEKHGSFYNTD